MKKAFALIAVSLFIPGLAVAQSITTLGTGASAGLFTAGSVTIGDSATTQDLSRGAVTIGSSASTGLASPGAVAIGTAASAGEQSWSSIALGSRATTGDFSFDSIAIGRAATTEYLAIEAVALGADAVVSKTTKHAVAIGAHSVATDSDTVSFGSTTLTRELVNVSSGTTSTSAVNKSQLDAVESVAKEAISRFNSDSVALGEGTQITAAHTIAVGNAGAERRITGVDTPIDGSDAANKRYVDAIGVVAKEAVSRFNSDSVALGEGTQITAAHTIAVGNAGAERRITGVDTPIDGSDAANKRYVDATAQQFDTRIGELSEKIAKVDQTASGGVAMALAMATPVSLAPGESALAMGVGHYNGESGFALTASHSIQRDEETVRKSAIKDISLHAGVGSSTAGHAGLRASVSLKF